MTKEKTDFLVDGEYSILDLVNLERLRNIFEQFTRSTGLTLELLDHPGLNILIGVGVKRICSEYHRGTPASVEICIKSYRHLADQLESLGSVVVEECGNGLMGCATPIIVKGKHIATLITGQFLMKPPDVERFRRQAKAYGYDEPGYMSALKDVPVLSEERVQSLAVSLRESAAVISEMGLANLEMKDEAARLANEVAERKRVEEMLRQSERNYREIFNAASDAIFVHDADTGAILDVNDAVLRVYGFTREEALRLSPDNSSLGKSPYSAAEVRQWVQKAIHEGPQVFEWLARKKSGELFWVEVSLRSADISGHRRILAVVRDITDRKQAEEALCESEAKYRSLVENSLEGIGISRGDQIVYANRALLSLFGYETQEEFISQPQLEHVAPESRELVRKMMDRPVGGDASQAMFECKIIRKDGAIRDVEVSVTGISIKGQQYSQSTFRDITERKRAENVLRASTEVIRAIPSGLIIYQFEPPDKLFLIDANPAALKYTGLKLEECVGKEFHDLWPEGVEDGILNHYLDVIRTSQPFAHELIFSPGQRLKGAYYVVAFKMPEDRLGVAFEDITERKRAQEELFSSRQMLELVLDNVPQRIFWKDRNSVFLGCNKAFAVGNGYTEPRELVGKTDYDLVPAPQAEYYRDADRRTMETDCPILNKEVCHTSKDGSQAWYTSSIIPLHDKDGRVIGVLGTYEDITDRKRSEEAIQAERAFANIIMDSIPGTFFVVDRQGRLIRWNRMLEELMEVSSDQLSNMMGLETIYEGDRDLMARKMVETFENGYGEAEARAATKDRPYMFFSGRRIEINGEQFVVGTGLDITGRKRAEEALRDSEHRFRSMMEQSPFSISVYSPDGRYIESNEAFKQLWGVNDEVLAEYNILKDTQIESLGFMPVVQRAFAGEQVNTPTVEYDARVTTGMGYRKIVQGNFYPLRDSDGTIRNIVLVHQNITERKQAEEGLRRRSEELKILNTLMERINATLSLDEVISIATDTVANMVQSDVALFFTREGEQLIPRRTAFRDPEAPREEIPTHHVGRCLCGLAVASAKPVYSDDIHTDARCTMDECRQMGFKSFAALPLHSGQEIMGILGLGWHSQRNLYEYSAFLETIAGQVAAACRNAMLHKQVQEHAAELERRVKERTSQLEAANKELEAFSYSVSHDLRAPLRAIDGFSHVLLEDYSQRLDAEGQDYLSRVRQNCQRMAQLIDDMLDLSRVTRSEIIRRNVDLAVLAKEVVSVLQAADPDRQVEWMLPTQMQVEADENLMRIVLENLLGNAWKFTRRQPQPRIELGEQREGARRVFFVRDNGAGFDMTYVGKLFKAFQRLHSAGEFEGTGIGLAIVQRIIHRHGGRIWAEGRVGQGATFFFTLP